MADYYNKTNVICTLNYVLSFFDGKMTGKEKKNFIKIFEHLSRYSYTIDNKELYEKQIRSNKDKIWQCWLQGEKNLPELVRVCTESVKKYNPNKEVVLITENNITDYINLPDYIIEKYKNGNIIPAHFSDIVRLSLLEKYGGVWIDSTIFQTGKLPAEAFDSEFFTYKNTLGECFKYVHSYKELELMCNFMNQPIMLPSTWFISSCANNIIISNWLKLLLEYWKHEDFAADYFLMDYFFVILLMNNKTCRDIFEKMPLFLTTPVHILQSAMPEEYDEEVYETIKLMSPIHKLTLKYTPDDSIKNRLYHQLLNGYLK